MKKISLALCASLMLLGSSFQEVKAENSFEVKSKEPIVFIDKAKKANILKEVASPSLNVKINGIDGKKVDMLNYFIQNVETGEIITKGETNTGRIKSNITIGKMIKEVADKKGDEVNYTDFVLRVYNNEEEVFANYFFSVPVFKNAKVFLDSASEDEIVNLLWIHDSHFKSTEHEETLSEAGYEAENNNGLELTLSTKDANTEVSFDNSNYSVTASCSLLSTSNARTAMGRITGNENLSSSLTIRNGGDLKIDTAVDGAISGSVTKSVTTEYYTPHAPSSPSSRIVYGQFQYGKYSCQDRYVYPYYWQEVKAIKFVVPDGSGLSYGIDGTTPSGTVGSLTSGQTYSYKVSNGYRFGAGTKVHGVTLGTTVAYSSDNTIKFTSKGKGTKVFDRGTGGKVWYSTPIK